MPAYNTQALFENLKGIKVIPIKSLTQALAESETTGLPFHQLVLDMGLISDENLGKLISDLIKVPFVKLSGRPIPEDILAIIPESVARKQRVVAFEKGSDGIKVAMADPSNHEEINLLEKKTGLPVKVYYATEKDINEASLLYKGEFKKTLTDLLQEQVEVVGKSVEKEAPVTKLLDLIIEYAYQSKASDIHIEPTEIDSLVRFRIDGVLHDVLHLPGRLHDQVVTRIKVLAKLRTDEHQSPQDGKLKSKLDAEDLDVRISIVPIVGGEKVVMRLLSSRSRQYSLVDLGLNEKNLEKVKNGFSKPYGMVLSTGPTGSGKTSTIYAILKIINTRDKNIATIEDPVEYQIKGVNQIQVNPKAGLTFADGLRSILRQDPDVVFVGEIRDKETAGIAINSALTGHLVLSTIHTNDAATTLPRLIDMNIEPFLVASTVNVIVAQRLVRKICDKCKAPLRTTETILNKHFPAEKIKAYFGDKSDILIYKGNGCQVCHLTGYVGRIGIFEILEVSEAVRDLIMQKVDAELIAKKAIEDGMTTMLDDGLDKVVRGITTIEEVMRAIKE